MLHVLKVRSAHHVGHGSGWSSWLPHHVASRGVRGAHGRATCRNHSVVKTLRNNKHGVVRCSWLAGYLLGGKGVWLLGVLPRRLHPSPIPHYRVGLRARGGVRRGVCRWRAHGVVWGRGARSLVLWRHSAPSVARQVPSGRGRHHAPPHRVGLGQAGRLAAPAVRHRNLMEGRGKAGGVRDGVYGVGVALHRHGGHGHNTAWHHRGHHHPREGVVGMLSLLGQVVHLAASSLNLNWLWKGWVPRAGRLEWSVSQDGRSSHHIRRRQLLAVRPGRRPRHELFRPEWPLLSRLHELGVLVCRDKHLLVLLALSSVGNDKPALGVARGDILGRGGGLGAWRSRGDTGPLGARAGREFHCFGVEGELLGVGIESGGNLFTALAAAGRRGVLSGRRGRPHLRGRAGFR